MTDEGFVKFENSQGIGTITFYHPSHNSLPGYLLKELSETITSAGQDEKVNIINLRSHGNRTFCAGASFQELISISNEEEGKAFFMGFANVINAIRMCPKFVIAAVQGKAVGGGVGLASAVDYCLATKYAEVKLSELTIGIGPFVVGPAVERKVGKAAFSQMAINAGNFYSAEWAEGKGLFQEVFESMEEMEAALKNLSDQLNNSSPEAQASIKKILWEDTDHWHELLEERAEISGRLVLSEYSRKVLAKYKEKK